MREVTPSVFTSEDDEGSNKSELRLRYFGEGLRIRISNQIGILFYK